MNALEIDPNVHREASNSRVYPALFVSCHVLWDLSTFRKDGICAQHVKHTMAPLSAFLGTSQDSHKLRPREHLCHPLK